MIRAFESSSWKEMKEMLADEFLTIQKLLGFATDAEAFHLINIVLVRLVQTHVWSQTAASFTENNVFAVIKTARDLGFNNIADALGKAAAAGGNLFFRLQAAIDIGTVQNSCLEVF